MTRQILQVKNLKGSEPLRQVIKTSKKTWAAQALNFSVLNVIKLFVGNSDKFFKSLKIGLYDGKRKPLMKVKLVKKSFRP